MQRWWLLGVVLSVLFGVIALAAWSFAWPSGDDLRYELRPATEFALGP